GYGRDAHGRPVEAGDPSVLVGHDVSVGQLVRVDADFGEITVPGRGRAGGPLCSRCAARADAHPRTPPLGTSSGRPVLGTGRELGEGPRAGQPTSSWSRSGTLRRRAVYVPTHRDIRRRRWPGTGSRP